jgi:hypothetical protein
MNETREVKNLAIGDVIELDGFDENMVVRSAKKIRSGLEAGKLEVTLATPDGEVERIAMANEEKVKVVGKNVEAAKAKIGGKGKGKGKAKAKAKTKAPAKSELETPAAPAAEPEPAAEPKAETPKKGGRQKKAEGEKKLSARDAAAKLLVETGQAMNCQEMIKGMADRGWWKSANGLTPHATLYSAILRELKAKGAGARFRKTEKGRFAANENA